MFGLQLENITSSIVDLHDGIRYQVVGITGLNPPSAEIFTSKSPNRKGSKYNGSSLNERNIVILIRILGDIEANRNFLYTWMDTENYTKIRYQNGLKNVYCEGYVQDCDIDFFTESEIISLAIICPDPYWKDIQEIATDISTLLKQFTFPFAISERIPLSTIRENNETNIYNGGAETGCQIKIICNDEAKNVVIYDGQDTSRQFRINHTLEKNWIVVIDSDGSPKTCKAYKPDGSVENLLKYVSNDPTWFTLKKGHNVFGYQSDGDAEDIQMVISFTNKYLGV